MKGEENCLGLCFNILADSSVADPFMSMGSALVRDLHVNEVNEKPARAPGLPPTSFCAVPTTVEISHSRFPLNLAQVSESPFVKHRSHFSK